MVVDLLFDEAVLLVENEVDRLVDLLFAAQRFLCFAQLHGRDLFRQILQIICRSP